MAEIVISGSQDNVYKGGPSGDEFVSVPIDLAVRDFKGRVGIASGDLLFFGTLGLSSITLTAEGINEEDTTGLGFGFGADYKLGNNFVLGAEYFARRTEFDDVEELELNLDTLSVRAAFSF